MITRELLRLLKPKILFNCYATFWVCPTPPTLSIWGRILNLGVTSYSRLLRKLVSFTLLLNQSIDFLLIYLQLRYLANRLRALLILPQLTHSHRHPVLVVVFIFKLRLEHLPNRSRAVADDKVFGGEVQGACPVESHVGGCDQIFTEREVAERCRRMDEVEINESDSIA